MNKEWQPIGTAPTDGARVIVYAAPYQGLPGFVCVADYHPDGGWCVDELREVTHWMPLPAPPPPFEHAATQHEDRDGSK